MNLFQIIVIALAGLLFLLTLFAVVRGRATRKEGFAWALVWLTAGVTVAWPRVTALVARTLGIGRGADLVLYCAVVVMLIGFLMVYVRLRRLRREMTLLVRHLAIQEAENKPIQPSSLSPADAGKAP